MKLCTVGAECSGSLEGESGAFAHSTGLSRRMWRLRQNRKQRPAEAGARQLSRHGMVYPVSRDSVTIGCLTFRKEGPARTTRRTRPWSRESGRETYAIGKFRANIR